MHADNDNNGLRFLSVCSGIEAASVAFGPLGWKAVAFSEIEKFPSAVLAHHYPEVPNLGDFTKIKTEELGRVDILCGGTPCQSFSVAGLRKGLGDARGNLTLSFVELAHELADRNGLRNVIWENVVGILSSKDNAFGCFLAGLVGADSAIDPPARGKWPRHGMVSGPKGRAAWAVKDGQFFGIAQRRRRVLVVADFGNGADPAAVLFEPESLPRHPPARGEAGKDVAGAAAEGAGSRRDWPADIASTLDTTFGPKMGLDDQHINAGATWFVPQAIGVTGTTSHALTAEGADASEDGSGRGTPVVVAFNAEAQADQLPSVGRDTDVNDGLTVSQRAAVAITAQTVAIRGRDGGATAELGGEVATALRASQGGGDKPHVLAALAVDCYNGAIDGDTTLTLRKGNGNELGGVPATLVQSAVRRLTPMECERLQGFPDGYTAIPWRGKPAEDCPDGPRYKALGNSWAVPKFVWLGKRIAQFMPSQAKQKPAAANDNDGVRDEVA